MDFFIIFLLILISAVLIAYIILASLSIIRGFMISKTLETLEKKGYRFKFIEYLDYNLDLDDDN